MFCLVLRDQIWQQSESATENDTNWPKNSNEAQCSFLTTECTFIVTSDFDVKNNATSPSLKSDAQTLSRTDVSLPLKWVALYAKDASLLASDIHCQEGCLIYFLSAEHALCVTIVM